MNTTSFIQSLAQGNALEAKETLNDLLSTRAFEALDAKKIEIAHALYGDREEIEVQDTADTPMEEELLTQEEFNELSREDQELYLEALDQLNEVSQKTAISAYVKRRGREDDDTGDKKSTQTMDRIYKKHGAKGVMRAATASDKEHGSFDSNYTKKDFVDGVLASHNASKDYRNKQPEKPSKGPVKGPGYA